MKHIRTFDEAVNEGFFSWLFKKIYKVSYTAEIIDKKTKDPMSYRSYITVKAKNEDEAVDKFYEKWDKAIRVFDEEPKVIVGTVKKTDKADKIDIVFPRMTMVKDEPKKQEPKKEEKKK